MRKRVELPVDVLEEILMRFPVKHVHRCKFLSKTFYDLITNPRFINKHLFFWSGSVKHNFITVIRKHSHSGTKHSLFSLQYPSLSEVYSPTPDKRESSSASMTLVGSSNGLVCAIFNRWTESETIELWNPTTREHTTIPPRPNSDPHLFMGFGYDSASDDYKLVMTSFDISQWQCWSRKTNDWRDIRTGPELVTDSSSSSRPDGVYIRGKLHWLARIEENKNWHDRGARILSFDLVNNRLCLENTLPNALASSIIWDRNDVIDFMGTVALSARYNYYTNPQFDIWVMDDSNKTWAKKFTIGPFPDYGFWYVRVCSDGELLITTGLHSSPGFLLYDLRNKKERLLRPSMLPDNYYLACLPCSYHESLVSVHAHDHKQ